jgi:hypothetical protein
MRNGEQPMGPFYWLVFAVLIVIIAVAFFVPH